MTGRGVTESAVEQATLAWLESAGWSGRNGLEIARGEPGVECDDFGQVALSQGLCVAPARTIGSVV